MYHGYLSAALVLGGVDYTGPTLCTIYPHGSTDKLPFVTMGEKLFTFEECFLFQDITEGTQYDCYHIYGVLNVTYTNFFAVFFRFWFTGSHVCV